MNDHYQRKKLLQREWFLAAALALSLFVSLIFSDFAKPLANVLYDSLMRIGGFEVTQDIVIVAIDDRSIQELGGWPIQRHEYAKLLSKLNDECCRPKAIGFDLLFLDHSQSDENFAIELKKHNSFLPLAFDVQEDASLSLRVTPPVFPLADAANLAHINLTFDSDGVIRGFVNKEQVWPHFSLAIQGVNLSNKSKEAEQKYYRFRMVDPNVGFPTVSLSDAIHSKATRTLLRNKYVLVGATAPSLGDRYPTLYSGKNNASTPGVAILASVLNASLQDSLIEVAPTWVVFTATILPLLLMLNGLVILKPRHALWLSVSIAIGSILFCYALLSNFNYWVDPTPLILITLLLQPFWAWRRLESIVQFVHNKSAVLRQFGTSSRSQLNIHPSREVVLQHAKLLDHAIEIAHDELVFLSAIVDEMPDSVLIFDDQSKLILSNQKIKDVFATYHFQVGSELTEFLHHINLDALTLLDTSKLNSATDEPRLLHLNTSLGERDFVVKTTKLSAPQLKNVRLIIFMDISELRKSQTQRDRALQFLSHDMRTPVASILSITEQTNTEQGSPETKIKYHANVLLQMMDDFILTISAEASQYRLENVLLDNLINDAIEAVVDLASAKKIAIKDQSEASNVFVSVNVRLLVRALINLLFNAVKFAPSHSVIHINTLIESAQPSLDNVVIIITNDTATNLQSPDPNPTMLGFGLGLDFVDNVIQKHKGSIQREIPNAGVAFVRVRLPCEITKNDRFA